MNKMIRSLFILGSFVCGSSLASSSETTSDIEAIDNAVNDAVNGLLDMYIDDCQNNEEAHGYYSAFFQPCNFKFLESTGEEEDGSNACSDENSMQLLETAPVNWIFNLSQHVAEFDWSTDLQALVGMEDDDDKGAAPKKIANDLVLWPDQCVGVSPRCYAVNDEKIRDVMEIIFKEKGFPETATHVSVDCRSDAIELSRVAYSFASGLGKSTPTILLWLLTLVLVIFVISCGCCICCCRLCCCFGSSRDNGGSSNYRRPRRPKSSKYAQIASAEVMDDATMASSYDDSEFSKGAL